MQHTIIKTSALAFLSALTLVGCQKAAPATPEIKDQVLRVSTVTTHLSTFSEVGVYYGKLAGTENATLLSVLGGRVDAIDADEGTSVVAGQSLGRVNSDLATAHRDVAVLSERIAKDALERQKRFLTDGNASQISVDQNELAWLGAKNSLIDAKKAFTGAFCITPIRGVVTRRYIEKYQELAPGSPTFSVSDIDKMKVTVGIPEAEIHGVALGNQAEISVADSPEKWKGTVSRLSREVSPQTLSFEAEITLPNPGWRLLPGTSATVTLQRRHLVDQILVPTEAVLTSGVETYVMVEANGAAHKKVVVTGPSSRTETVVAKGLEAGEHVIVQGNNLTADGAAVVVTRSAP